ncbi:hypothetical protein [Streptomyces lancefieldiae]|uniref:Peptidoglycan binding domain-containing protein n=1 Tax=Streptomyces lancefieldiae TaxID=3075520 RepID=A0ABU3AWM3_9ACTN|nr:hypothetical protein [Streptomyces sp. DSM 40712]MDT0614599.1 hypothetical protein [Streptomyces sp. DSM 40712]
MSRETDSSSSGPHGRGGAAYPSGTPPYGTPVASDAGVDAGRSASRPEDRKTETTLTTRIRINIPGSRPIPPVVMRKPVADAEGDTVDTEPAERPAPSAAAPAGPAPETPAEPAQPAEEKPTSDWFAPRKSGSGKGVQGGGSTNGAGLPGGSGTPAGGPGAPGAGPSGAGAGARPGGGSGRPGGVVGSMNVPGGSRSGSTNGAGLSGATGGPVAPGHGGGTGSFDVTEALAAGPLGNGTGNGTATGTRPGTDGGIEPRRDDLPYFSGNEHGAPNHASGPHSASPYGGPQGPAGPTGGPVTGEGRLTPPPAGGSGDFGVPGGPGPQRGSAPNGLGAPGGPAGPAGPGGPGRPQAPGTGRDAARPGPGGGLSDDTAILTPQKPAPEPGTPGYGNPDNVSGNTVTSGIPVVPSDRTTPFRGASPDGPLPHTPPKLPEPVSEPPAGSAKSAKPARKKGRKKLPLLVGGLVFVAGVVYGAGLLMNRSDVPKGTTVLGVDIGGGTRDDAVEKLDDVLGARASKPLKLAVGGETVSLKPDQAGLQLDTQATASAAAKSDYNPVSVVGSLFGQQRVVDPVMPVDEEKLHAALGNAAGGAGSVTEGTIRFESGRAVPVYGKAGKGIDVAKSTDAVAAAYRAQVETGTATPVNVPTTAQQPTVSKAEVDRMMAEFAEPAMSARVTVQTDAAHSIQMSPEKSLWKFLRVTAIDGKLVDKPDLNALKELYGQTFDGVLITRANGEKTAVTPEDVYGALRQALKSKTDRVAVIETDPS